MPWTWILLRAFCFSHWIALSSSRYHCNILWSINLNKYFNEKHDGLEMFGEFRIVPFTIHPIAGHGHPRLACCMVLGAKWGEFLALMGICCSTFVSMSRGSTFRSIFLPQGCPISIAVYRANKALCRPGVHDIWGKITTHSLPGVSLIFGYIPAGQFSYYSSS